jgi:hypothetical protein
LKVDVVAASRFVRIFYTFLLPSASNAIPRFQNSPNSPPAIGSSGGFIDKSPPVDQIWSFRELP